MKTALRKRSGRLFALINYNIFPLTNCLKPLIFQGSYSGLLVFFYQQKLLLASLSDFYVFYAFAFSQARAPAT